jgi:hypothetical protein
LIKEQTKEEKQKILEFMLTERNFLEMARQMIYPLDKVAYQAINSIISMSMISMGRKYGLDYDENVQLKEEKEEKNIDSIIEEINKETE